MTRESKLMCGITLLTITTIEYGGTFLLDLLSGKHAELALNEFQRSMFRAGHAHAGVWVILSLIAQLLIDHTSYKKNMKWSLRAGFPLAAILVSGGFFASAIGQGLTTPNSLVCLIYAGGAVLFFSLIGLGVGLIKAR